jgi:hypothetical protein
VGEQHCCDSVNTVRHRSHSRLYPH